MEANLQTISPVPSLFMQRHEQQPNKVNEVTDAALKALERDPNSAQSPPFEHGPDEINLQIRKIKKIRKQYTEIEFGTGMAYLTTGSCTAGFGLYAIGLGLLACATKTEVVFLYFMLDLIFGMAPCAATSGACYKFSRETTGAISDMDEDTRVLKQAIKNIQDPEYIAFIESQNFDNLEALLILPDFHRYIDISLQLKNEWRKEKEQNKHPSADNLKKRLELMEREGALAKSLSERLKGHFKRFDITQEE